MNSRTTRYFNKKALQQQYLKIDYRDLGPRICGHGYRTGFLMNLHQTRKVSLTLVREAWYMGAMTNREEIPMELAAASETSIGCNGFANDSGGYDTLYKMYWKDPSWV